MDDKRFKSAVTDLETLFPIKLSKEKARMWRDIITLFLIFGAFFFGLACFGGLQYYICQASKPNITLLECFQLQGHKK